MALTIHKFAKSQLRTDSQNSEKLASSRLGTKPLVGFSLGGLDPLSPLMIERPSRPCQFSDTETMEIAATAWPNSSPEARSMVSWARSGAMFLGCSGEIGGSGGSAAGGVFILIDVSKTTNLGGTSGTQNVRFCDLRICGLLSPKNGWMIRKFTIHNLHY